jgi:hypothetical protein
MPHSDPRIPRSVFRSIPPSHKDPNAASPLAAFLFLTIRAAAREPSLEGNHQLDVAL